MDTTQTRPIQLCILLLLGILASPWCGWGEPVLATPSPDSVHQEATAKWQKALATIAQKENIAMLFALGPAVSGAVPNMEYQKPAGKATMRALARATGRTWSQVQGLQTFAIPVDAEMQRANDLKMVTAWVHQLGPAERLALVNGSLKLAALDTELRERLLRLVGDRDIHFALLDNIQQAVLSLRWLPKINYHDIESASQQSLVVHSPLHFNINRQNPPQPARDEAALKALLVNKAKEPLEPAAPGPLDFGPGSIMPLREVLRRATLVSGVAYHFNQQRLEDYYFVCGQLSAPALNDALKILLNSASSPRTVQAQESPGASSRSLLEEFLRLEEENFPTDTISVGWLTSPHHSETDISEVIPVRDFLIRRELRVSELARNRPGLTTVLLNLKLSRESSVTLDGSLRLEITTDGTHQSSYGYMKEHDRLLPAYAKNQASVTLY